MMERGSGSCIRVGVILLIVLIAAAIQLWGCTPSPQPTSTPAPATPTPAPTAMPTTAPSATPQTLRMPEGMEFDTFGVTISHVTKLPFFADTQGKPLIVTNYGPPTVQVLCGQNIIGEVPPGPPDRRFDEKCDVPFEIREKPQGQPL